MSVVRADGVIRVGILGNSDIARRRFIPALLQSRQAVFCALASRNREALIPAGPTSGVQLLTYEELINSPEIDLVYISPHNHLHEKWAVMALEQGKHVLCEKPLGLSADSVGRMLAVAELHKVLLFENIMYLQHPLHALVKGIIDEGKIGRLHSLQCVFTIPELQKDNFRMNPDLGGGAFHDLNRYPLSAALYFLKGHEHRFLRGSTSERNGLNLSMGAESVTDAGESFSFQIAFEQPYRSCYEIIGEDGQIRVERAFTTPSEMENRVFFTAKGEDQSFSVLACDHFLATIEQVCGVIRNRQWSELHWRASKLGELAELFYNKCRRGNRYD